MYPTAGVIEQARVLFSGADVLLLNDMATTILQRFSKEKDLLEIGEKAAKMAMELKDSPKYITTYATLIYLQGDKKRAISVVEDAIARFNARDQKADMLIDLKSKLEAS